MDCKRALSESDGDMDGAIKLLRKKGMATAEKKSGREASEGLIQSYVHLGGKVGVLLELNCESDFVAKTEAFQALAKDLCMHVAAASPQFVDRDGIPESFLAAEREVAAESVQGKPQEIVEKIVQGKIDKIYSQVCMLEQPFVKDPDQTVQDVITGQIATLGENIVVRRFVRYQVGE